MMNKLKTVLIAALVGIPVATSAMPYAKDSLPEPRQKKATGTLDDTRTEKSSKLREKMYKLHAKRIKSVERLGYMKGFESISLCEAMLDDMKTAKSMDMMGFMLLEDYDTSKHANYIPDVNQRLIKVDSHNYIHPDKTHVTRIYTDTVFGELLILHMLDGPGVLYPEELAVERFMIGDRMADVFVEKHARNKWSTTITFSSDHDYYRIEAGRKLEGSDLTRFMRFAKNLVETS